MSTPESLPLQLAPDEDGLTGLTEERIVSQLRREGILGRTRPRRPNAPTRVAAGLALFFGGAIVGQWMQASYTADIVDAALDNEAFAQAVRIQEAGSAYVQAVARLIELADHGDPQSIGAGREAAGVALHAAALELARLSPEDPSLQQVLSALDARSTRETIDDQGEP